MAKPVYAYWGDMPITCQVCKGDQFRDREVKLNSSGMELFNMAWANESATGLICWQCGYVHLFANRNIDLYRVKR